MSFFSLPRGIVRSKGAMLRAGTKGFEPKSMIDMLFDYGAFLKTADAQGSIAQNGPASPKKVAVVGAGASGLVATYELSRVANITVDLFEANDRFGGRMDSKQVPDAPFNTKIFEMGCMRFPPTSYTLYHYLNKFNISATPNFPDPGKVPTKLLYQNEVINWPAGETAPENANFIRIGKDFGNMVVFLLGDADQPDMTNPKKLFDFWAIYQDNPNPTTKAGVVKSWQSIIDQYKDTTYYHAVFDLAQNTDIVEKPWTQEDMNRFGALGVGSGGFGPLYVVNFVDILRLFANAWEADQELLLSGIIGLVNAFVAAIGQNRVAPQKNTKITNIHKTDKGQYILTFENTKVSAPYDAVIVATTTRAMQYMGLTVDGVTNSRGQLSDSILNQGPKVAIRDLHLMNSSKLFVSTKTKFWYAANNPTGKDLPFNIQTDELMRGLYCMNYDKDVNGQPNTEGKGVILISYVWGDDSSKLLALSAEERFQQFLQAIQKVNPTFAELLVEQREEMKYVDWENTKNFYGAFKLNYPGQEQPNHDAFFQYQAKEQGVFLAGDSVSWAGGWLEGAMPTGVNAACAAVEHVGGQLIENNPMDSISPTMYTYDNPPLGLNKVKQAGKSSKVKFDDFRTKIDFVGKK